MFDIALLLIFVSHYLNLLLAVVVNAMTPSNTYTLLLSIHSST